MESLIYEWQYADIFSFKQVYRMNRPVWMREPAGDGLKINVYEKGCVFLTLNTLNPVVEFVNCKVIILEQ